MHTLRLRFVWHLEYSSSAALVLDLCLVVASVVVASILLWGQQHDHIV